MIRHCLRLWLWTALITGIGYPLLVTAIGALFMPYQAGGSLLPVGEKVIGSLLIAQKFEGDRYFWPRPSAVDFNPLPSGGSNLGPTSAALKKAVDERRSTLAKANGAAEKAVPRELLFASGSGLDPHITPSAAMFQVERIAKARSIDAKVLTAIVDEFTRNPTLGFLGEARVNVLEVNKHLDDLDKQSRK